jgi:uncharacterized protein YraI
MPRLSRALVAAGVFLAGLVLAVPAAQAAPAYALSVANVRSGPGLSYAVVGAVYPGQRLTVTKCTPSWCYVVRVGADGWVSRRLLVNPLYSTGIGKGYEFPPRSGPGPGRYLGTPDRPM